MAEGSRAGWLLDQQYFLIPFLCRYFFCAVLAASLLNFNKSTTAFQSSKRMNKLCQLPRYATLRTLATKRCCTKPTPSSLQMTSTDGGSYKTSLRNGQKELFSLAPMMDYTDRHMRFLMRLLSKDMVLYTEMIASGTIVNNPENELGRWLDYSESCEHPVVLQLGGSDPGELRRAAARAAPYRYDAVNLNCGCPSEKVAGKGCFGAALMREAELVGDLCRGMAAELDCPVTVKSRIGVDDEDSYEGLCNFIETVADRSPVRHFIVHARTAILGGLSPAQNRQIPPLKYDYVYNLVKDYPEFQFTINGGITEYEEIREHLGRGVHGVMVGRAINADPYKWSQVDELVYGAANPGLTRRGVLEAYGRYCDEQEAAVGPCIRWLLAKHTNQLFAGLTRREILERYGEYCDEMVELWGPRVRQTLKKHILNFFVGQRNGKKFRCAMDKLVRTELPLSKVFSNAAEILTDETLDAKPGEKVVYPDSSFTSAESDNKELIKRQKEERQHKEATLLGGSGFK